MGKNFLWFKTTLTAQTTIIVYQHLKLLDHGLTDISKKRFHAPLAAFDSSLESFDARSIKSFY
jgi:hypothetical protein